MSSIEIFITWSLGFVILALLVYTLYRVRNSERTLCARIITDRVDTINALKELREIIIKRNDELRHVEIDKLAEKNNLNSAVGVRVGLSMAVDMVNDYIKMIEKEDKEAPAIGVVFEPENKNKYVYDFDTVSKAMFGEDVK